MSGMKDSDFDDLIRKSVKEPPIRFNPDHWQKLEKKLLDEDIKRSYHRITLISLLIIFLLFTSFIGWLYFDSGNKQRTDSNNESSYPSAEEFQLNGQEPLSLKNDDVIMNKLQEDKNDQNVSNRSIQHKNSLKESGNGIYSLARTPEGKIGNLFNTDKNSTFSKNDQKLLALQGLPPDLKLKNIFLSVPDIQALAKNKQEHQPSDHLESRFFVSFVAAPNVSSVNFNDMSSVGLDVGFSLEYFVNKELSIVAGAIHSTKIYGISEGYKPAYIPVNSYGDLEHVDGRCSVVDIPINLRYYFNWSDKHQFFLSGGISSYLMLREKYDMYYKGGYGELLSRTENITNENKHFFSIINLSVGYEKSFSKRFSFQVEPYVKIPVAGIGYGNIDLTSTGAFISIKYKLK